MAEPTDFPEANRTLTMPIDEEGSSLRVWDDGTQTLSAWSLSWRERFSALVFGRVWLWVRGGQTQPPVWIQASRTVHSRD